MTCGPFSQEARSSNHSFALASVCESFFGQGLIVVLLQVVVVQLPVLINPQLQLAEFIQMGFARSGNSGLPKISSTGKQLPEKM